MTPQTLRNLPRALDDDGLRNRLAGRRPAVFLDYDGVLFDIWGPTACAVTHDAGSGYEDLVAELNHLLVA